MAEESRSMDLNSDQEAVEFYLIHFIKLVEEGSYVASILVGVECFEFLMVVVVYSCFEEAFLEVEEYSQN